MFKLTNGLRLDEFGSNLSISPNICITIEYDGTKWYGYIYTTQGSAVPDRTNDGQLLYSFIWDAAGNFVIQFGLLGDEQVNGVTSIFIYSIKFNKGREAQWDAGESQYTFTDLQLATELITEFNAGTTDMCLHMSIQDGLVIDYNYNTILTGTA